jgi:hypothetical protein
MIDDAKCRAWIVERRIDQHRVSGPLSRRWVAERAAPAAQQRREHNSFKGLARGDRNITSAVAKP